MRTNKLIRRLRMRARSSAFLVTHTEREPRLDSGKMDLSVSGFA
jgi:hypothetical protein